MGSAYKGAVKSDFFTGEAQMKVEEEGLLIDWLFDSIMIPFNNINSVSLNNYIVMVASQDGDIAISRLGQSGDWFFKELKAAFDSKVLTVLKEEGTSSMIYKGRYHYQEKEGPCRIQLFEDSFCILPEDVNARRVPLIFINCLIDENYNLQVQLTTGEEYKLFMMGRDYEPFVRDIKKGIRDIQEKNRSFVTELCCSLTPRDEVVAARLMPEGIAVSKEDLRSRVPELVACVEKKIANSKMRDTYRVIGELGDASKTAMGIKRVEEEEFNRLLEEAQEATGSQEELTDEQIDALRWTIWAAIPSRNGKKALVEFAFPGEAAATYIFDVIGSWEEFLPILNRAMEAVGLAREIISLSPEELADQKFSGYQMAIIRTPALELLRSAYAGKVAHRSMDSWRDGVMGLIQ